ncbi:hypothetical protein RN001_003967 [Aquatica leii]|uniref:Uncharacterized protein n=1 Tax=Aquatica leii TaxID=1421715 RepID=A0AAN7PPI9_9COLE|nr:hypothetical protein RN001_003967 [Aquatica leii]
MWCLFLIVLFSGNGLATADEESNEGRRVTQEVKESAGSIEAYGYDGRRVSGSREEFDEENTERESRDNTSASNGTFTKNVQTHPPFDTETLNLDDSKYVGKTQKKDATNGFDNTGNKSALSAPPFVSDGSHTFTENKNFQKFLVNHGINTDNVSSFEHTTETANRNDSVQTSIYDEVTVITLPSVDYDLTTLSSKISTDSTTSSIVKLSTDTDELDHADMNKPFVESNASTNGDTMRENSTERSFVNLPREDLEIIKNVSKTNQTDKKHTTSTVKLVSVIYDENSSEPSFEDTQTIINDTILDYIDNIKTNVDEIDETDVKYTTASTTEVDSEFGFEESQTITNETIPGYLENIKPNVSETGETHVNSNSSTSIDNRKNSEENIKADDKKFTTASTVELESVYTKSNENLRKSSFENSENFTKNVTETDQIDVKYPTASTTKLDSVFEDSQTNDTIPDYLENIKTHADDTKQTDAKYTKTKKFELYTKIDDSTHEPFFENSQTTNTIPYLETTKTDVTETDQTDVKHTTESTTELDTVYTKTDENSSVPDVDGEEIKVNTEVPDFTFDFDDLSKTAEDIFNDQNDKFPTTSTSSNFRGILDTWLQEQKQKLGLVNDSGAANDTSSTEATLNKDTDFEQLLDNAERMSYFDGRIIDDSKVPCILLNATYKIYLYGSQVKLPIQYDTFGEYKRDYGSITFNAGDGDKINASIKFTITCTKEFCFISTIAVKLRNVSGNADIISEQKGLNLFKTDYGFASENEDRITYMMNNELVLEIDHAKLHVMRHCNITETIGESGLLSNYKEIFGGVIAIFILAGLGTYILIRSHRKQKLVLGSKAARVLFGAPNTEDVGDIDASIEEQINDDKERFRVNFGIDIDDFEECIPGTYLVNITQRKVNKLSLDKKLLDLCSRRTRKAKTRLRSSVE